MSKVALVRCDSYELERVREAIEQALDPLGGMGAFVKPGQRVLIKVNMLRPSPPEAAVTTHPSVAVALALMVRDLGAHPAIGDSCGGAKAYGLSEQALVETGIKPLADEHGIETILFETAGMQWMERPQNKFLKIFPVSKAVLGADVIINAPKLKTHVETLLTGAVKNMFGALPGASKLRLHRAAPGPVALGQALLDIYSTLTPRLNVMDGILALHEKGPSWGKPKHVGAILASADGVALDHTAARIVGIDPMKVPTIAPAKEREIGENDAGAIEVIGETIEAMRPEDFKLVSNGMMLMMPKPFLDFINHKLLVVRPKWNPDGCKRAGACEKICPVEAITVSPESVAIDFGTCIDCMACVMACPNDGLRVRKGLVAKVLSA